MKAELQPPVRYSLSLGGQAIPLNPLLGHSLRLTFSGAIHCIHCGRETRKSFNQGYCYPCFKSLAQCDICIVKPEQCHYHLGTCREPEWAQNHCLEPHYVYLANSSGIKVGITRHTQLPTRWLDQGAVQAMPVFKVATRQLAGLVEVVLKAYVSDRTSWQTMLKGGIPPVDLVRQRDELLALCQEPLAELRQRFGDEDLEYLAEAEVLTIDYPVLEYPAKVKSLNFDKAPEVAGTLLGIKGQYLIFDSGVINIRKFGGYQVALESDAV